MIISLNWLKKYVQWDIPTEELVELIGSRLVEVEEVIDQRGRYDDIIIVKVVEAEKIEGTHLTLCKIESGKGIFSQVLCGAPNVRVGMLAVWIKPGATVPSSFHEDAPFVIGTKKMRGHDSHGMLAGADELGFSDIHATIAEIDPEVAKPGDKFADIFHLDDILLDIENKSLTHRPDCFGIIGFAREVAGILGQQFKEPDFLVNPGSDHIISPESLDLKITIKDPELCPRYEALIMHKKDQSGPEYLTELATLISRAGMRSIDPIVDMTNYLMLLTGQPLHAFDWDKLVQVGGKKTPEIIVRSAKQGEKITLLNGKEVEMADTDIVITSNNIPVALAGAMGGQNTVIDKSTKRIIVESATFSLYNLRKTQMRHGVFSEAITRFTKGQPAALADPVVREFAREMSSTLTPLALFDEYPSKAKPSTVKITTDEINATLGTSYTWKQIEQTLRNVSFDISCTCGKSDKCACEEIAVTSPFWRTDIHINEDITEEVGRLLGYDTIPPTLPLVSTDGAEVDPILALKKHIRTVLSAGGANEILSYSFVHGDLLRKSGQDPANSYKIINSISPALEYIRQNLTPSLLDAATVNLKDGYEEFTLFEMNLTTHKGYGLTDEGVPVEKPKLALAHIDTEDTAPYYALKLQIESLLATLGITPQFTSAKIRSSGPGSMLSENRSAEILDTATGTSLGIIGEITPRVAHDFKLPAAAVAQLQLDEILKCRTTQKFTPISTFPTVRRDLTLTVPETVPYAEVAASVHAALESEHLIFKIHPISIYQPPKSSDKSISFSLEFASPTKTLKKGEIDDIMEKVSEQKF